MITHRTSLAVLATKEWAVLLNSLFFLVEAEGIEAGSPGGHFSPVQITIVYLVCNIFWYYAAGDSFLGVRFIPLLLCKNDRLARANRSFLVEAGGIEPPSETISTGFSTGVVCNLFTLFQCVCRRTHRAGLLISPVTPSQLWENGAGV